LVLIFEITLVIAYGLFRGDVFPNILVYKVKIGHCIFPLNYKMFYKQHGDNYALCL